jgi:hypothetical protein
MRQLSSCAVNFTDDHVTAYVRGHLDTDTAQCLFAQLVPYVAAGRDVVVDLAGLIFMGPRASLCWPDLKQCAVRTVAPSVWPNPCAPPSRAHLAAKMQL